MTGPSQAFEAYGDNARDLYDNIIDQINKSLETMKSKRGYSRINHNFNGYAGTTLEEREFMPPPGVKVFKFIGEVKPEGTYEPHPELTPKAKAAPPLSPETMKRLNRFPPGTDPSDAKGITSPTSPHQQAPMNWPPSRKVEGHGKGSRGNTVPCDSRDVRVGDGSVLPLPGARSPSYKEVASASGFCNAERRRGLPQVSLPGQAGPGPTVPINVSAPDIKLNLNRPMGARDNEWPLDGLRMLQDVLLPTFAMVVRTRDITSMDLMDTSEWQYSCSSLTCARLVSISA